MGRKPCCDKEVVKRGPWTVEEDRRLITFMHTHCQCRWRAVPQLAGLRRCGKSCRLRWTNYLRPDLKRGLLSEEEEKLIIYLHSKFGNRWSRIAAQLPGRTDNEIKNHWNTRIKKKLRKIGIDPNTHKSITPIEEGKKVDEVHPLISSNSSSVGKEDPQRVTTPPPPEPDPTAVEMEELDEYISNFCTGDVPLIQPDGIIGASSSMGSSVPSSASTTSSNGASPSSTIVEEEYSKMPPPCDPTSLDIDVSDYLRDLQTEEIPQIQADEIDGIITPCGESADHDPLGFHDLYDMALFDDSSTLGFGCSLDLLFDNNA